MQSSSSDGDGVHQPIDTDDDDDDAGDTEATKQHSGVDVEIDEDGGAALLKGNTDDDDDDEGDAGVGSKSAAATLRDAERRAADSRSRAAKWTDNKIASAVAIVKALRRPDETAASVIRDATTNTTSATAQQERQQRRASLVDAITTYETEEALASTYQPLAAAKQEAKDRATPTVEPAAATLSTTQEITNVLHMTRDELLSMLLAAVPADVVSKLLPPAFLLLWTDKPPSSSSRVTGAGVFGPFDAAGINGWAQCGFFEKKAACVIDMNAPHGKRQWVVLPRKTVEKVV